MAATWYITGPGENGPRAHTGHKNGRPIKTYVTVRRNISCGLSSIGDTETTRVHHYMELYLSEAAVSLLPWKQKIKDFICLNDTKYFLDKYENPSSQLW